jgi:hypothetical protein
MQINFSILQIDDDDISYFELGDIDMHIGDKRISKNKYPSQSILP